MSRWQVAGQSPAAALHVACACNREHLGACSGLSAETVRLWLNPCVPPCSNLISRACVHICSGYGDRSLAVTPLTKRLRQGIFVMPRERVTILSSYVHCEPCEEEARDLRARLVAANGELERIRAARLPGN